MCTLYIKQSERKLSISLKSSISIKTCKFEEITSLFKIDWKMCKHKSGEDKFELMSLYPISFMCLYPISFNQDWDPLLVESPGYFWLCDYIVQPLISIHVPKRYTVLTL